MFYNHCLDPNTERVDPDRANAVFHAHPLQLSGFVERAWRAADGHPAGGDPFAAWPEAMIDQLDRYFAPPPGGRAPLLQVQAGAYYPHIIYSYLIENTKIYDVFFKVLQAYRTGESLGVPSAASQRFWRNVETLVYSDPPVTSIWSVTSRVRPDEVATRQAAYYAMLGLELDHVQDLATLHPYTKWDSANVDFQPAFESLGTEIWRGLINANNISGPNDADDASIALHARRLHQMLADRRQHANMRVIEFRSSFVMSLLHLAVSYDSQVVVDLRATMGNTGSAGDRLGRIAKQVGIDIHPQAQALFDLAHPASALMWLVESGQFNTAGPASQLYLNPLIANLARTVLAQYSIAMNRDLKATNVKMLKQVAPTPTPMPRLTSAPRPLALPGMR